MFWRKACALCGLLIGTGFAPPADAALLAGDIVVSNDGVVNHGVLRVDPDVGTVEEFAVSLEAPIGLAYGTDGHVFAVDAFDASIHRIDADGRTVRLYVRQRPEDYFDVAVEPSGGMLLPVLFRAGEPVVQLLRIDPLTDERMVIAAGGALVPSSSIEVAPDGTIFATAFNSVLRIDPQTGAQSVVADVQDPVDITVGPNGDLFVTAGASDTARVIHIDPVTGILRVVSGGGLLEIVRGIAVEADGDILVANRHGDRRGGDLLRIDPLTGAQSRLASVDNPFDLIVVPIPEPTSAALALAALAPLALRRRR